MSFNFDDITFDDINFDDFNSFNSTNHGIPLMGPGSGPPDPDLATPQSNIGTAGTAMYMTESSAGMAAHNFPHNNNYGAAVSTQDRPEVPIAAGTEGSSGSALGNQAQDMLRFGETLQLAPGQFGYTPDRSFQQKQAFSMLPMGNFGNNTTYGRDISSNNFHSHPFEWHGTGNGMPSPDAPTQNSAFQPVDQNPSDFFNVEFHQQLMHQQSVQMDEPARGPTQQAQNDILTTNLEFHSPRVAQMAADEQHAPINLIQNDTSAINFQFNSPTEKQGLSFDGFFASQNNQRSQNMAGNSLHELPQADSNIFSASPHYGTPQYGSGTSNASTSIIPIAGNGQQARWDINENSLLAQSSQIQHMQNAAKAAHFPLQSPTDVQGAPFNGFPAAQNSQSLQNTATLNDRPQGSAASPAVSSNTNVASGSSHTVAANTLTAAQGKQPQSDTIQDVDALAAFLMKQILAHPGLKDALQKKGLQLIQQVPHQPPQMEQSKGTGSLECPLHHPAQAHQSTSEHPAQDHSKAPPRPASAVPSTRKVALVKSHHPTPPVPRASRKTQSEGAQQLPGVQNGPLGPATMQRVRAALATISHMARNDLEFEDLPDNSQDNISDLRLRLSIVTRTAAEDLGRPKFDVTPRDFINYLQLIEQTADGGKYLQVLNGWRPDGSGAAVGSRSDGDASNSGRSGGSGPSKTSKVQSKGQALPLPAIAENGPQTKKRAAPRKRNVKPLPRQKKSKAPVATQPVPQSSTPDIERLPTQLEATTMSEKARGKQREILPENDASQPTTMSEKARGKQREILPAPAPADVDAVAQVLATPTITHTETPTQTQDAQQPSEVQHQEVQDQRGTRISGFAGDQSLNAIFPNFEGLLERVKGMRLERLQQAAEAEAENANANAAQSVASLNDATAVTVNATATANPAATANAAATVDAAVTVDAAATATANSAATVNGDVNSDAALTAQSEEAKIMESLGYQEINDLSWEEEDDEEEEDEDEE